MEQFMKEKDFSAGVQLVRAALTKREVLEPVRFDVWNARDWTVFLVIGQKRLPDSLLDKAVSAFEDLGLTDDGWYGGGFDRKLNGHPFVIFHPRIPKAVMDRIDREEEDDEQKEDALRRTEVQRLIEDLKAGKLRSNSDDGFLVLAGEFYDAIERGEKTVERRALTAYNLKRTIGLRTIRLQRGYGRSGCPPKQMRFRVRSVRLADAEGRECDPFAVPAGFEPVEIEVCLGTREGARH